MELYMKRFRLPRNRNSLLINRHTKRPIYVEVRDSDNYALMAAITLRTITKIETYLDEECDDAETSNALNVILRELDEDLRGI